MNQTCGGSYDGATIVLRKADDMLDTRVRLRLLGDEHRSHKLTMNVYLSDVGAQDARVWCATCGRTLRTQGRVSREDGEIVIGLG